VIVSEDGIILTNNHVIADADEVTVRLADDREFPAKIVGTDPKTDLGVLKIDADDLVPATLGDSDRLEVGEWVLTIGSPFGLSETLTAGIVSAKGRGTVGLVDYGDFIQTDAAINPGNSGGPLVDLHGAVVGINTAIFSRSGGSMGIGFAIPVKIAKAIKDRILAEGRVVRGYLGVFVQDLTGNLARSFGRDETGGALVAKVSPGTPAARAGLQPGDIVLELDGVKVRNSDDLRKRVSDARPDEVVHLVVFRKGEQKTLTVKLAELPDDSAASPVSGASLGNELGMEVHPLTPEIGRAYGYAGDVSGLVVVRVKPLTPADRAGIRAGDVLLEIGDRGIRSVADYRTALERSDLASGIRLRIRRGEAELFVFLRAEEE
jgi:serine protease Do